MKPNEVHMNNSKEYEDWMNRKWRPALGWVYMAICIFDFLVAPIAWSVLMAMTAGSVENQWNPITLEGAGLFHMAMGAVLGIAAWTRGQEKIARMPLQHDDYNHNTQNRYSRNEYQSHDSPREYDSGRKFEG